MRDFQQQNQVHKEQDWEDLRYRLRAGEKVNLASNSQLENVVNGAQEGFDNPQEKMRGFLTWRVEGFLSQSLLDPANY